MTSKLLIITAFLLSSLTLGACNTFEGLGQDTQAAGEALEDEAN
ncbi:MAG TPA: entericidin A/B family lipoprotein [Arenibaculum sp.]|nr:entericidin A/B family lipoprotein [Arenibaculum sp.]